MRRIAAISVIAAPLCFLAYGVIRLLGRMDGRYGPGLDWQAAHIADLAGLALFVPVLLGVRRLLAPGWGREAVVGAALAGVAASMVQFTVDIVAGALAADKAEMAVISDRFSSLPGAEIAFYQVGPQLLYLGVLVLSVLLVRAGLLRWWSPVLLLAGTLAALDLDLIPVAALCYLAGLAPLARPLAAARTGPPNPYAGAAPAG